MDRDNKPALPIVAERDITAKEFLQKLKQHCAKVYAKQSCRECRFLDFCYCAPTNYTDEFLSDSIAYFS
ncbi:hypothetical protein D1646_15725 [Pseudoflavonifractor sp. 60]|nr:hypothetical protein [Pseudoflavonifractor sp. 60]